MRGKPKGTYRVAKGCAITGRKPGTKVNVMLNPGTIIPQWAPEKALKDWIASGHAVLDSGMNPAPSDAANSQRDADKRPTPDAPGVTTKALDLEHDETGGQDKIRVEPVDGAQPQPAAENHNLNDLQLTGKEAEAEAERQAKADQTATEEAAAAEKTKEAEVVVGATITDPPGNVEVPGPKPVGTAPQQTIGRFILTTEQLLGKNLDELNAMVNERLNDEESAAFDPYETVQEAAAHLGQDIPR